MAHENEESAKPTAGFQRTGAGDAATIVEPSVLYWGFHDLVSEPSAVIVGLQLGCSIPAPVGIENNNVPLPCH